ncbi:MAG: MarR family winged helix-turn-helix transcriptional regulator [Solirubrobacteraceae bacterium]
MKSSIISREMPPTQRTPNESNALARTAYEFHASLERELHETLVELDLTDALADAVWQLDPALAPLSRRELAERLRCDPSNVTFLVDRLERKRLVTRTRVTGDRRIRALALTAAGRQARRRLIATVARSSMFRGLTTAEQRQLAELLGRCVSADGP